jgi:hypothetical protein
MRTLSRLWFIGVLALVPMGCGKEASNLTPVRGKVYFRGVPLTGGTIVFTPDPERGGSGPLSFAEIQPDGSYALRTSQAMGAVAGWHRVTITDAAPTVALPGAPSAPTSPPPLPRKYSDPEQSGECREVQPSKENVIDFNLE